MHPQHLLLLPSPSCLVSPPFSTMCSWPQLLSSTHPRMWHQGSGENTVFSRNMLLSSLWWNLTAFHQILQFPLQFYFQACFCFISAMLPTNQMCFHTLSEKRKIKCEYILHWAKQSIPDQGELETCLNEIWTMIFIIKYHISTYWNLMLILHFILLTKLHFHQLLNIKLQWFKARLDGAWNNHVV